MFNSLTCTTIFCLSSCHYLSVQFHDALTNNTRLCTIIFIDWRKVHVRLTIAEKAKICLLDSSEDGNIHFIKIKRDVTCQQLNIAFGTAMNLKLLFCHIENQKESVVYMNCAHNVYALYTWSYGACDHSNACIFLSEPHLSRADTIKRFWGHVWKSLANFTSHAAFDYTVMMNILRTTESITEECNRIHLQRRTDRS